MPSLQIHIFKYHLGNNVCFEFGKFLLFELQIHSPAKMDFHVSKSVFSSCQAQQTVKLKRKLEMNEKSQNVFFQSTEEKKNFLKVSPTVELANW